MGRESNIDWTDSTWNPIRGCSAVSPGCKNCYAAKVAKRFSGPGKPFEGLVRIDAAGHATDDWNGEIRFVEEHLLDPLKWCPAEIGGPYGPGPGRPRRIFVNSVSDLFHENLSRKHLVSILAVMALCPQHRFQVLTKRHERMAEVLYHGNEALKVEVQIAMAVLLAELFAQDSGFSAKTIIAILDRLKATARNEHDEIAIDYINPVWPLRNVIVGVSVENQEWADKRWEPLYLVSKVGWRTMVSYEPALGPVDWHDGSSWGFLDWLISGGESQAGARPSHAAWHRAARDFAAEHGIAYFFKQWGDWLPDNQNPVMMQDPEPPASGAIKVGKKKAGHLLDGKEHRAFPEGF